MAQPAPTPKEMEEALEFADRGEATTDGRTPFNQATVLREIFLNLSTQDLVNCSQVNHLWNYEARTVLRDFKTCVAVYNGDTPCRSLRDLDADLSRMTVVPYNGLHLRISDHPDSICTQNSDAEFNFLRNEFKLKVLKIDWNSESKLACPAVSLLKQILKGNHGDTVEEVNFLHFPSNFNIASLLRPAGFPKLRIIRLAPRLAQFLSHHHRHRIPFLDEGHDEARFEPFDDGNDDRAGPLSPECPLTLWLNGAPNLDTLDVELPRPLITTIQQKYPGVLRSFRFPTRCWEEETRGFALAQPKLEILTAFTPEEKYIFRKEQYWDTLKTIFLSSAKTLKHLTLDSAVLARFRSMNLLPLQNLETLILWMTPESYEDEAQLDPIRRLNFSRLCPKLDFVTVHENTGERRSTPVPRIQVYLDDDDEEDDLAGYSKNIWKLHVEDPSVPEALFKLAQIFGHVTSLTVSTGKNCGANRSDIYVDLFRCGWMNLRTVRISQFVTDLRFNLDGAFCGISSKELAELQRLHDEFLRRYDLVPDSPDRPGLSALKSLKQLHISLRLHGKIQKDQSIGKTPKFFLSRVTGLCLLSRMKELQIIVQCDPPEALKHLESFVKVIGKNDELAKTQPKLYKRYDSDSEDSD